MKKQFIYIIILMLNVTVYAQDTISFYFESGKFELSARKMTDSQNGC